MIETNMKKDVKELYSRIEQWRKKKLDVQRKTPAGSGSLYPRSSSSGLVVDHGDLGRGAALDVHDGELLAGAEAGEPRGELVRVLLLGGGHAVDGPGQLLDVQLQVRDGLAARVLGRDDVPVVLHAVRRPRVAHRVHQLQRRACWAATERTITWCLISTSSKLASCRSCSFDDDCWCICFSVLTL